MQASEWISKQEKEAEVQLSNVDAMRKALEKFPDLEVFTDRWGKQRWGAKSANPHVTDYEYGHTCGCCSDTGILIRPYLECGGQRIYSNPSSFDIGEGRYSDSRHFRFNYDEQFIKVGVNPELVKNLLRLYPYGPDEEGVEEPF